VLEKIKYLMRNRFAFQDRVWQGGSFMPRTMSAWLLPTGEKVFLNSMSHAEVVGRFLTGLLLTEKGLGEYCKRDFLRFLTRENYQSMSLSDAVEDYAVLCLRWIKIGNAYGFNNNNTITIADYDGNQDKIDFYRNVGYHVNVIPITIHCYETISESEYRMINVLEVVKKGRTIKVIDELK